MPEDSPSYIEPESNNSSLKVRAKKPRASRVIPAERIIRQLASNPSHSFVDPDYRTAQGTMTSHKIEADELVRRFGLSGDVASQDADDLQMVAKHSVLETLEEYKRPLAHLMKGIDYLKQKQYEGVMQHLTNDRAQRLAGSLGFSLRPYNPTFYSKYYDPFREFGARANFDDEKRILDYRDNPEDPQLLALELIEAWAVALQRIAKKNISWRYKMKDYNGEIISYEDVGCFLVERGIDSDRLVSVREYLAHVKCIEFSDEILKRSYPGKKFELLTTLASSANLYIDPEENSVIYKVCFPKRDVVYDTTPLSVFWEKEELEYIHQEVANLQRLSELGLTPKVLEYKNASTYPIIKMERIVFEPDGLKHAPRDVREKSAEEIAEMLEKFHLYPFDVEFVWDSKEQQVRLIDCGGLGSQQQPSIHIKDRVRKLLYLEQFNKHDYN